MRDFPPIHPGEILQEAFLIPSHYEVEKAKMTLDGRLEKEVKVFASV